MTDYDIRQLNLMIAKLNDFERGNLSLNHLVSSLDGIQNALQEIDNQWRNAFLTQWGVLEDINAEALERHSKDSPSEQVSLASRAIRAIRHLVAERMTLPLHEDAAERYPRSGPNVDKR